MSEQPETEAVLVQRVQQGDLDAFAALMNLHVHRLRAFIAIKAPVPHLIDEIAHESFVFAYRRINEFRPGDFGAWLRAIAFNLLRAEHKRLARDAQNRERYAAAILVEECLATEVPQAPGLPHLAACLDGLPAATRELLDRRYRERQPIATIARDLGRSAVAVRATLFRVRRQLRDCILRRLQTEET